MELVFKSTIVLGQREKASPCGGIRQQMGIRHLDVESPARPAVRRRAGLPGGAALCCGVFGAASAAITVLVASQFSPSIAETKTNLGGVAAVV
jgi:hypothetical protein